MMKLIKETCGCQPGRYYYEVRRTYDLGNGRQVTGVAGFDGGLLGTEAHEMAVDKAKREATADAREQVDGSR